MKRYRALGIILILFLAACSSAYTLEGAFKDIKKIDAKYDIDFKKEKLNGTVINYELINPVLDDLYALREKAEKRQGKDTQDILDFIDARILMIESQRYWILAKNIGPRGVTRDGFTCEDFPFIKDATKYYTKSWVNALDAFKILDELLARNEATWDFIGVNREKPDFYRSPLDYISNDVRFNIFNMQKSCNIPLASS